jgi:hypothetical protein
MTMRTLTSFPLWLAVGSLALAASTAPYERPPRQFGDTVARCQVEVRPGPTQPAGTEGVRLTGPVLVTLSIEGPATLEVVNHDQVVAEQTRLAKEANVGCKVERGPEKETLDSGRARWQVKFLLEAGQDSKDQVGLVPLRFRAGAAEETVTWDPVPLQQRDITGIVTTPPPPSWPTWLLWVGAGLVAIAVGLGAGQLLRRRLGRTPPLTAVQWARQELDRIEGERLPEAGEVERYHTEVSDVVRRYLEKQFRLRARRQTTAEFLEAMHKAPQLQPAQQALLRDFLERCDLAKFAKVAPPPEECREVGRMARALVEQTAPAPPTRDRV